MHQGNRRSKYSNHGSKPRSRVSDDRKRKENKKGRIKPVDQRDRVYGFDNTLFMTLIFLLAFGLVMLYSVSFNTAYYKFGNGMYFVMGQLRYIALGFLAMLIILQFKHTLYGGWRAWLLYGFAFVLMVMVKTTPFGVTLNGASRWLDLPGLGTFQPSEFMKVGVITLTPTLLYKMKVVQLDAETAFIASVPWMLGAGYTYIGTDNLSTAIIIAGIGVGMLTLLAPNFNQLVGLGVKFLIGAVAVIVFFGEFLYENLGGFRLGRLFMWTNLEDYANDGGYQVLQGLYAIGSGGLFGKGLGNGTQKLSSIPEVQNDMIFAAISEELGIFGLIILLFLYCLLLYRLFVIASNAPTLHSSLIVAGIFLHIALQVVVNLCVVTALLPNTGVTLPFISYGGTALLVLICEISIALGISRQ